MLLLDRENGADVDCSVDGEALASDGVSTAVDTAADGSENEDRDFDSKE